MGEKATYMCLCAGYEGAEREAGVMLQAVGTLFGVLEMSRFLP